MIETESSASLSVEEQSIVSVDQKHSSRVAKVHYQKLRSRDISLKSKALLNLIHRTSKEKTELCIEGCTESNTCEVASDLTVGATERFGNESSNTIPENYVELPKKPDGICHASITTVQAVEEKISEVNVTSVSRRCSKSPSSHQEDSCLKKGLNKYGNGHWTSILTDKDYSFHHHRKGSSLMCRAKILGFINNL